MEQFEPPVNPLPPVAIALALLVFGVELIFSAGETGFVGGPGAVGWRLNALNDFGFTTLVWDFIVERGDYSLDLLRRFVTYPFVSGSFTSALFGGALILALGKFVGEIFGNVPTLIVFVVATVFGAFAFGLLVGGQYPLYGAFTPVYGLIGAYTYVIFTRLGSVGGNQLQAFRLIAVLLAIQLVFGLIFGDNKMWVAELAGFIAGFCVSILAAPGGWSAFLARMRG